MIGTSLETFNINSIKIDLASHDYIQGGEGQF